MPGAKQNFLLLDCGANVECRPEMLNAFGTMGSVYAEKVMGRTEPKVALVNNGAEDTKGTPTYREAHQLLKANPCIHFAGNIEPRYIMDGEVDVVVCDGFVGNVVLKLTEGVAKTLLGMLKKIFLQNLVTKLSYLGIKGGLGELKRMMDSEAVSYTHLLRARGVTTLAAALYRSRPLDEAGNDFPGGVCVVIGSEGQGLTQATVEACDMAVRIPMTDRVESLNAAVAGSVLLWHFRGM